jgi:hypothetical protein
VLNYRGAHAQNEHGDRSIYMLRNAFVIFAYLSACHSKKICGVLPKGAAIYILGFFNACVFEVLCCVIEWCFGLHLSLRGIFKQFGLE